MKAIIEWFKRMFLPDLPDRKLIPCPVCDGKGTVEYGDRWKPLECVNCKGRGTVVDA